MSIPVDKNKLQALTTKKLMEEGKSKGVAPTQADTSKINIFTDKLSADMVKESGKSGVAQGAQGVQQSEQTKSADNKDKGIFDGSLPKNSTQKAESPSMAIGDTVQFSNKSGYADASDYLSKSAGETQKPESLVDKFKSTMNEFISQFKPENKGGVTQPKSSGDDLDNMEKSADDETRDVDTEVAKTDQKTAQTDNAVGKLDKDTTKLEQKKNQGDEQPVNQPPVNSMAQTGETVGTESAQQAEGAQVGDIAQKSPTQGAEQKPESQNGTEQKDSKSDKQDKMSTLAEQEQGAIAANGAAQGSLEAGKSGLTASADQEKHSTAGIDAGNGQMLQGGIEIKIGDGLKNKATLTDKMGDNELDKGQQLADTAKNILNTATSLNELSQTLSTLAGVQSAEGDALMSNPYTAAAGAALKALSVVTAGLSAARAVESATKKDESQQKDQESMAANKKGTGFKREAVGLDVQGDQTIASGRTNETGGQNAVSMNEMSLTRAKEGQVAYNGQIDGAASDANNAAGAQRSIVQAAQTVAGGGEASFTGDFGNTASQSNNMVNPAMEAAASPLAGLGQGAMGAQNPKAAAQKGAKPNQPTEQANAGQTSQPTAGTASPVGGGAVAAATPQAAVSQPVATAGASTFSASAQPQTVAAAPTTNNTQTNTAPPSTSEKPEADSSKTDKTDKAEDKDKTEAKDKNKKKQDPKEQPQNPMNNMFANAGMFANLGGTDYGTGAAGVSGPAVGNINGENKEEDSAKLELAKKVQEKTGKPTIKNGKVDDSSLKSAVASLDEKDKQEIDPSGNQLKKYAQA